MNIRTTWPLILLTLIATAARAGGDGMNNGGGLSEQNFTYSWMNMERFTLNCLVNPDCVRDNRERLLLQDLHDSMPAELAGAGLRFESGSLHPELFPQEPSGSLAMMSSEAVVGGRIWINQDRIYVPAPSEGTVPLPFAETVRLLLEELAKRHTSDRALAADVAQAVSLSVEGQTQEIHLGQRGRAEIRELLFENALILLIGDISLDVTQSIAAQLPCAGKSQPEAPRSRISNLHWGEIPEYPANPPSAPAIVAIPSLGRIEIDCSPRERYLGQLEVEFSIDGSAWNSPKEPIRFIPGSLKISLSGLKRL